MPNGVSSDISRSRNAAANPEAERSQTMGIKLEGDVTKFDNDLKEVSSLAGALAKKIAEMKRDAATLHTDEAAAKRMIRDQLHMMHVAPTEEKKRSLQFYSWRLGEDVECAHLRTGADRRVMSRIAEALRVERMELVRSPQARMSMKIGGHVTELAIAGTTAQLVIEGFTGGWTKLVEGLNLTEELLGAGVLGLAIKYGTAIGMTTVRYLSYGIHVIDAKDLNKKIEKIKEGEEGATEMGFLESLKNRAFRFFYKLEEKMGLYEHAGKAG